MHLYTYYLQLSFITILLISTGIELYLHLRQISFLKKNKDIIPPFFAEQITIPENDKSIKYTIEKLKLSLIKLIINSIVLFILFPGRGLNSLFLVTPSDGIMKDVFFLYLLSLLQILISLPFSYYSTFKIEEKYGFNRSNLKLFFLDKLKTIILSTLIITPLFVGLSLILKHTNLWWLLGATFLTLTQLCLVFLFPKYIAPIFNKFSPLNDSELSSGINQLADKIGFKIDALFVMDASKRSAHGNAYFTGFGKSKRIVFFDTLLKDLTTNEVLAVLAHELGHMKLNHILKSMISSVFFTYVGFYLLSELSLHDWFYRGHFLYEKSEGILLILFFTVFPVYSFISTPFFSILSRKKEFEADAFASKFTNSNDLISALIKLYKHNSSPLINDRFYSNFYHSHPSAVERIEHLKSDAC